MLSWLNPGLLVWTAILLTAFAAVWDLKTGQIPNFMTLPLLVLSPFLHTAMNAHHSPQISPFFFLAHSLIGLVLCGLVPFLLWKKGGMGGGDVKLLAGIGALLGPAVGMQVELYAFLAALVLAPLGLVYRGELLSALKNTAVLVVNPIRPEGKRLPIPQAALTEFRFGPAIFAATAFLAGPKVLFSLF
jgi:prepilin peptidase CpaA